MNRCPNGPLRAAIERSAALYRRGALDESVAAVEEARRYASAVRDGLPPDEIAALAEGWELQALVALDRGGLQAAVECFARAEQILENHKEHDELRGRICFQAARALFDAPRMKATQMKYAQLARVLLAGSEKYSFLLESMPDERDEAPEAWRARRAKLLKQMAAIMENLGGSYTGTKRRDIHSMMDLVETYEDRVRALRGKHLHRFIDLAMNLVYLCVEEGDNNAARESFATAGGLAITILADNVVAFFQVTRVFSHILDRPRLNLGHALNQVADMAMRLAVASNSSQYLADAYFLAALRDREMNRLESCLENALASTWHEQCYQSNEAPSVLMRSATKHRLDERRALAADIALQLSQAELVAELIESARLQALARTAQVARGAGESEDGILGLLAATGMALQDVHPVSVGGRSRMAEAAGVTVGPLPLPLEPAIGASGGPRAVYWGSWAALQKCYWALRTGDGAWSAGVMDLGAGAEALLAANSALRNSADYSGLLDYYEQELSMARKLGLMVLPPPLADTLMASVQPLSLVVAGSFVCDLPLPALVIPGTSDERLIERAVISVQPPLVLTMDRVSYLRPAERADDLLVRIACLDPSGDLPFSRNYDVPCETLLTSPANPMYRSVALPPVWSKPADRANLTTVLHSMSPGEPAVFFYSGHVSQNGVLDGPETSLVLMDGFFSAAELAAMPIPSHALFSACSSSGASGTGAGEWLGMAGSLLRGGARQVVATSWPIPDSEFTAQFERGLVARICASGEAADALRQSQIAALVQWRSYRGRAIDILRAPLPRTWAAFQAITTAACIGERPREPASSLPASPQ